MRRLLNSPHVSIGQLTNCQQYLFQKISNNCLEKNRGRKWENCYHQKQQTNENVISRNWTFEQRKNIYLEEEEDIFRKEAKQQKDLEKEIVKSDENFSDSRRLEIALDGN